MNKKELIKEVFRDSDLSPDDYLQDDDYELNLDDVKNKLMGTDLIIDQEIIFYTDSIKYLRERDVSLNRSLGLAMDAGYTIDKINSGVKELMLNLANLLYQENLRKEFEELWEEVERESEED